MEQLYGVRNSLLSSLLIPVLLLLLEALLTLQKQGGLASTSCLKMDKHFQSHGKVQVRVGVQTGQEKGELIEGE